MGIRVHDRLMTTPRRGIAFKVTHFEPIDIYKRIKEEFGIHFIMDAAEKISGCRMVPSSDTFINWMIQTDRLEILYDGFILWYDERRDKN